jgi:hypothetical protein
MYSEKIEGNWMLSQVEDYGYKNAKMQKRINRVVIKLNESDSGKSFPAIFQNKGQLKGFYNMINYKETTHYGLIDCYRKNTAKSIKQAETYYVIQDTMEVDYSTQPNKEGMGYLHDLKHKGFLTHNGLILTEDKEPLGLIYQGIIVRAEEEFGKKKQRKKKEIEEKESYKWIDCLIETYEFQQKNNCRLVHIMDCEGDITMVMNYGFEYGQDFIIRSTHDRILEDQEDKLWENLSNSKQKYIEYRRIRDKNGKEELCKCEVSFQTVNMKGVDQPVYAVYLRSLGNIEAEWLILTSLKVETIQQAIDILDKYQYRWIVEEFHKGLKTGCILEKRRFDDLESTLNSLALLSLIAVYLLRIRYSSREKPDENIENSLTEAVEKELLPILAEKYLRPTQKEQFKEFTSIWLTAIIAALAGHHDMKNKGMPGWITLWKGWNCYKSLLEGFKLARLQTNYGYKHESI